MSMLTMVIANISSSRWCSTVCFYVISFIFFVLVYFPTACLRYVLFIC